MLKPYHLPNAAGDMALTLEDTARFGYVRQSGAVQSSEYRELYPSAEPAAVQWLAAKVKAAPLKNDLRLKQPEVVCKISKDFS